ncbi:MAG TPA: hypothetical protein VG603_15095 [Chitinophagales bacterium]|nr:hypothetical protein [Chitinophagales bacterium]
MKHSDIEETKKFLNKPEISVWIDKYDDVFSDYDSRPFAERSLSDDFLREVRKMASEKSSGDIQLKFHILDDQRDPESEQIIINNLNKHFENIAQALKSEQRNILNKGFMLLAGGTLLIVFLVFLNSMPYKSAFLAGLHSMLEPVGWFMSWTGLDHVFQNSRKAKATLHYNSMMAHASIEFSSFGEKTSEGTVDINTKQQKTVIPFDDSNLRVA